MYVWTWILQNTYVMFLTRVVQTVDNAIHWIAKDNKCSIRQGYHNRGKPIITVVPEFKKREKKSKATYCN